MSNLGKRVLTGIIGIPLLAGVAIAGGNTLLVFTVLLSSLALWEFYGMFFKKGFSPHKLLMIFSSAALVLTFKFYGSGYLLAVLCLAFFLSSFAEIFKRSLHDPVNVMIDMFGLVYISIPMAMLNDLAGNSGFNLAVYAFVMIWSCDSFSYFGGRIFGRRKLSPVSPNKTIEGSATGLFFTAIISIAIHFLFPERITFYDSVFLGVLTGVFSQAGDLFESMLKRYCEVKDSSSLIPGHGGILDRFDSLLFVVPFVYIYFLVTKYA